MKKIMSFLLAAAMLFLSAAANAAYADNLPEEADSVFAEDLPEEEYAVLQSAGGECGENLTWTIDGRTLIISGTGDMENYSNSIPPWYQYYSNFEEVVIEDGVTSIGDFAFVRSGSHGSGGISDNYVYGPDVSFDMSPSSDYGNNYYIESISIPDSVTKIGKYAFAGCSSLRKISIPETVTSIGEGAFAYCYDLTSVSGFEVVTAVADYTFYKCGSLTEISISDSVTSIGKGAFAGCGDLADISGFGGITAVADYTFYGCNFREFSIPETVTSIGKGAFADCGVLEQISIPETVTSIGEEAFAYCDVLEQISIPASVKYIGKYAFEYCPAMTDIFVGKNNSAYEDINGVLFSKDGVLIKYPAGRTDEEYSIPDTTVSVGDWAFYACMSLKSLKNITVPASVTEIGEGAFQGWRNLENIFVNENNIAYKSVDGVLFNKDGTVLIQYPSYREAKEYTIPASVTSVKDRAFYICDSLTDISVPDSVTEIGEYAFASCDELINISLPDKITSIMDGTFALCRSLTSISIPESVTSIGNSAFYCCFELTDIDIPSGVTNIGKQAFSGCEVLESVVIPAGVEEIKEMTFLGCYALKNVTIPDSVKKIGYGAFSYCNSLKSIFIPDSVEEIEDDVFDRCDHLVIRCSEGSYAQEYAEKYDIEYRVPISVPVSGKCGENVTWTFDTEGVLTISGTGDMEDYEWAEDQPWRKYDVTSVVIKNGVESVGDYAFSERESLKTVVIPESVTKIGDFAFDECTALTKAEIHGPVTRIGYYAFYKCTDLENIIIPETVTRIGEHAFSRCESLSFITIPAAVTNIGGRAFYGCSSLISIIVHANNTEYRSEDGVLFDKNGTLICCPAKKTGVRYNIPDSTVFVENGAFADCGMEHISIPASVTEIAEDAFYNCISLKNISVSEDNTAYRDTDGVLFDDDGTVLIRYPQGRSGSYTIPDSVTSVARFAFRNCTGLTGVVIPDSVTSFDIDTFTGCDSLKSIFIPKSVTDITGDYTYLRHNVRIKCYNESYAQVYANVYNIDYDLITQTEVWSTNESPVVCGQYSEKVHPSFSVDDNGEAVLDLNNTDNALNLNAYIVYFDDDGNIAVIRSLKSTENGSYRFKITDGNYKIMLWEDVNPVINAIEQ